MSEESKKSLPQIAITAYESNEEDIEVTNLLNGVNEENNVKIHEPRSVSPKPIRHKSRIILKSPITTHLQKSLSPGLSDLNSCTDVEVMSDSDEEKYYIRTPNLTPGPIDYFILTDIEDLSEDEGYEKNNKVIDELTDTEHFTDDKGIINEVEYTEQPLESMPYFPQPHREILFHSKDGTVSALSPTEESNPIWLKSPNEEVKGFESEEEIITVEEHGDTESYIKNNNNTYYHDIDVGVVESVETVKQDRYKHKYRNRVLTSKKNITPEAECGKKRYRNKNRCNSEIEESFENRSEENKKKTLSKFMSEPTLSNVTIPKQNQNMKTNKINNQENNNTFVIHDNRNGFSISIDFQSQNSVLLSVGRDYGNLSMRWFNDGITTGRAIWDYNNDNILEPLEPGYIIKSSLYDPKRQFEVDLFTYGTVKTFQNRYFTYIAVYTVVQPVSIVQLYINRPLQTQITMVKNPLVNVYSLKDKFTSVERLHPSPVTRLSAFKIFNQKQTKKNTEQKKINFEPTKHVSDVINIFESMCGSPKLRRKFNFKQLSNLNSNIKICDLNQKYNCICIKKISKIGDEANQTQQQNAKSIDNSDYFSNELFSHNRSHYFDNKLINTAITHSREELAKLVKAVEILENKVEKQEHLTNDFQTRKSESESSSDGVSSLDNVQKRIYRLLNDVHNQENQVRHSLSDIMQKINHCGFPKTNNIQEIQGPSFRGNFNTASLPYRWWNRSMPCLPLSERHIFLSGSQDSLSESFQICYFTPKKKKKSVSRMSKNQNSGYCIWLPHNKTENDRTQIRPLMVRTPSENTVPDDYEHLDEWKPVDYSKISPDTVQEKLKTMLSDPGNHDETLTNLLIDMLIEQETAKLAASGELSSGSSDSDPHETRDVEQLSDCPSPIPIISSPKIRRNGVGGSQRLSVHQRPTFREINKDDSESDNDNEYIVTEPPEKLPGRKVTFRLESEDDEIVYPGQSDSENDLEDCNVSMSTINQPSIIEDMKFEMATDVGEKSLKRVERRFERMASETLEDSPIAKQAVEGEYHRIISQLSNEEVDVANQIWDGAGSSEEIREQSKYDTKQELQVAASKPELKCEISMDDDTEIDLREHDWRFQHQINTETDDITKPSTSGWTGKSKPKENVSEL